MRGRWLVVAIVLLGVALAVVAATMRGRHEPRLPLAPGALLLLTVEEGPLGVEDLGPLADHAIEFERVHGVSSDAAATLGAIVTGRMPRENGLLRAGDAIAPEVPVLADLLSEARFTSARFDGRGQDVATALGRAGDWLLARGTSSSFCHVHLERADRAATAAFFTRLHGALAGERLVVLAVGFGNRAEPTLMLRLPGPLLPRSVGENVVSLLDVVPSALETFGIRVRPELMEPFLLGPSTRGPRFFLFTEPLAPPPPEHEGCDAVTLHAAGLRYSLDPRRDPPEHLDDARAGALVEMRRILESAFHYRLEPPDSPTRARFQR